LVHRLARYAVALLVDGKVVVRAGGKGDAPPGHRAVGIQARRVAESPDGLVVIEGVDETQALVEVALRLGAGRGDGVAVRAEAVEDRRVIRGGRRVALRVTALLGRATDDRRRREQEQDHEDSERHQVPPPAKGSVRRRPRTDYGAISPFPWRTKASCSSA